MAGGPGGDAGRQRKSPFGSGWISMSILRATLVMLLLSAASAAAMADNPANWNIVEQVNRTDTMKTWNSPTAIDLGKMVWAFEWEITKVTGTVNLGVFGNFTQDITSQIPPEQRMGAGDVRGLPAVLIDEAVADEATGTSAHLRFEIDNLGFGRAVFSEIMLGSVNVPLFGTRPIQRIDVEASVLVAGFVFGDYDRNGSVNAADYDQWKGTFGATMGDLRADGNGNNVIDAADYVIWRNSFAAAVGSVGFAPTNVPEPAAWTIAVFAALAWSVMWLRAGRDTEE
jgi:hypothetical protein